MRSATLLLIRMKAAETSASSAIADWTPLTVVSRSSTTAEIETFMSDVSTTRTNIAAASSRANRELGGSRSGTGAIASSVTGPPTAASETVLALPPHPPGCGATTPHPAGMVSSPVAGVTVRLLRAGTIHDRRRRRSWTGDRRPPGADHHRHARRVDEHRPG